MTFQVFKSGNKLPVVSVSCGLADFHPKVSKIATTLLYEEPVGSSVWVKSGAETFWFGKRNFKRIITDKV